MNRNERRIFEREGQKIRRHFDRLFNRFMDWLFEDNGYTYKSLYRWVNLLWVRICEHYNRRFKMFKADSYWFANEFKPLENGFN